MAGYWQNNIFVIARSSGSLWHPVMPYLYAHTPNCKVLTHYVNNMAPQVHLNLSGRLINLTHQVIINSLVIIMFIIIHPNFSESNRVLSHYILALFPLVWRTLPIQKIIKELLQAK